MNLWFLFPTPVSFPISTHNKEKNLEIEKETQAWKDHKFVTANQGLDEMAEVNHKHRVPSAHPIIFFSF